MGLSCINTTFNAKMELQVPINEKYSQNISSEIIIFTTFVRTLNKNTMLVNFTFQNFRSFRDEKTLSMEAGSIKELKESVIQRNLIACYQQL